MFATTDDKRPSGAPLTPTEGLTTRKACSLMADRDPMCPAAAAHPPSNAELDARDQAEVLREVLGIYPETLTLDELIRELTVASTAFTEVDRIHRAVRVLTAGGGVPQ